MQLLDVSIFGPLTLAYRQLFGTIYTKAHNKVLMQSAA
ncbi:hypothetical protein [Sporisorium scitamineum]|uniref:Uncharacterized protein n=1 Tax=Sporisorium scitamineum TaxID=49012 RepID=A0A0F7S1Q8_9BASI|nr:hypothetical protein [Sporisorium scitamineum]